MGGMLFRVVWVPEGGRIHSTLVGEGFRCRSSPASAGRCSGHSLITKPRASEDKMKLRLVHSGGGVEIYLGQSFNKLCLMETIVTYLTVRGERVGPFFQFHD